MSNPTDSIDLNRRLRRLSVDTVQAWENPDNNQAVVVKLWMDAANEIQANQESLIQAARAEGAKAELQRLKSIKVINSQFYGYTDTEYDARLEALNNIGGK